MSTDVRTALSNHRIMLIFRGLDSDDVLGLAATAHQAGIRLFEVTMNSPEAGHTIRRLREKLGNEVPIGAGTVLTPDDVDLAAEAGAGFVVAPNVNEGVLRRAQALKLGTVPGAFTPTEVLQATALGADVVKFFPVNAVGPDYIRQLRAPIGDVPLMATGGVDRDLAAACIDAGCVGVGVGVHLLQPHDAATLEQNTRKLVAAVNAAAR
jgi:2-dehydro-3-deoxyphosphogluconate aldolase / (4S)-4-hydroxy-2-oxoglutarate aldolase